MANISLNDISNLPAAEQATAYAKYDRTLQTQLRDLSLAVTSANDSVLVQTALNSISTYDGTTPLRDFVQDLENYKDTLLTSDQQAYFLRGVIAKLRGRARSALEGKNPQNITALIKTLKDNFAPSRSYAHYVNEITLTCMKRNEKVRDFHNRLNSLIRGAISAARESLPPATGQVEVDQRPQLELLALETFVRGLPDAWRCGMASANPATFQQALEIAVNLERYHSIAGTNEADIMITLAQNNALLNQQTSSYSEDKTSSRQFPQDFSQSNPFQNSNKDPPQTQQVKFIEKNDPNLFNRQNVSFRFDPNDQHFPKVYVDPQTGKIVAPPQLSYGSSHSGSSLKPTNEQKSQVSFMPPEYYPYPYQNLFPPHYPIFPQVPFQTYPWPYPPPFYQSPYFAQPTSQPPYPRAKSPANNCSNNFRPNSPKQNLNSNNVRPQGAGSNNNQSCQATQNFVTAQEYAILQTSAQVPKSE